MLRRRIAPSTTTRAIATSTAGFSGDSTLNVAPKSPNKAYATPTEPQAFRPDGFLRPRALADCFWFAIPTHCRQRKSILRGLSAPRHRTGIDRCFHLEPIPSECPTTWSSCLGLSSVRYCLHVLCRWRVRLARTKNIPILRAASAQSSALQLDDSP
ncbi:hypothetical protein Micbo1qcDRAFT_65430 [Microdochium bolleyi]|uniref:Uncharacterized protein n=1 Tax=Microdochium bolleyi TaxID=196109 RepID=A0A136J2W5_9PEZI|nr:hypothetical protein Micbo1qcDRAFT_65430 [Microdochium bolleyi]